MSELAESLPDTHRGTSDPGHETDWQELKIDLAGGQYKDPDPNVVDWINQKFTDPQENIEATVIKAFELAGIIRPLKDTLRPLEHAGLLPTGSPPTYADVPDERSPFMDRREEQLLDEFISDDATRNRLLSDIKRLTAARINYDESDVDELWSWGKEKTKGAREMPEVLRELTVMLGIRPPEDSASTPSIPPPPTTRELAPDIYLMMLRESEEYPEQ